MTVKLTVIYDNPTSPEAFETDYADGLVELAGRLPDLLKIETSKVFPKEDGSPTPAYRMVDLYFADYDTAVQATGGAEAAALFPKVLGLGTGGLRILLSDVEQG